MREPENLLEWVIYEWMKNAEVIPCGAQEKVAKAAYDLAAEIQNKVKVDVNQLR